MATIDRRENEDGTWRYRVRVRIKGQPLRSATFPRLAEAKLWGKQEEAAAHMRRHFPAMVGRHTLSEAITRYQRDILPTFPPHSQANARTHLAYWDDALGEWDIGTLTPAQIAGARDALLRRVNPGTCNRYLGTLGALCRVAHQEWGWLLDNPLRGVRKPKEPPGRIRFLNTEERTALLAACQASDTPCLYPLVVLALTTGARRGELTHLRWHDVDFERATLTFAQTKNGDRRSVPLVAFAHHTLLRWRHEHPGTPEGYVFASVYGKPSTIYRPWKAVREVAGLTDFRFHDLRHTAASYLAMSGASTLEIAAILGHHTLQMVQRYSHLTPRHLNTITERMAQQFLS